MCSATIQRLASSAMRMPGTTKRLRWPIACTSGFRFGKAVLAKTDRKVASLASPRIRRSFDRATPRRDLNAAIFNHCERLSA